MNNNKIKLGSAITYIHGNDAYENISKYVKTEIWHFVYDFVRMALAANEPINRSVGNSVIL